MTSGALERIIRLANGKWQVAKGKCQIIQKVGCPTKSQVICFVGFASAPLICLINICIAIELGSRAQNSKTWPRTIVNCRAIFTLSAGQVVRWCGGGWFGWRGLLLSSCCGRAVSHKSFVTPNDDDENVRHRMRQGQRALQRLHS